MLKEYTEKLENTKTYHDEPYKSRQGRARYQRGRDRTSRHHMRMLSRFCKRITHYIDEIIQIKLWRRNKTQL